MYPYSSPKPVASTPVSTKPVQPLGQTGPTAPPSAPPSSVYPTVPIHAETFVSNVKPAPTGKVEQTFVNGSLNHAILDTYKKDPSRQITVLNIGNYKVPGGPVQDHFYDTTLRSTQEQDLFKAVPQLQTSLESCMLYPYDPELQLLWTPKVPFERHPSYDYDLLRIPFMISVVTVGGALPKDHRSFDQKQFIKVLSGAMVVPSTFHSHHHKSHTKHVLVLGLGPGTFENDLEDIAYCVKRCLERHAKHWQEVVLAVPDSFRLEKILRH